MLKEIDTVYCNDPPNDTASEQISDMIAYLEQMLDGGL